MQIMNFYIVLTCAEPEIFLSRLLIQSRRFDKGVQEEAFGGNILEKRVGCNAHSKVRASHSPY
jgi:hypothetical protein